MYDIHIVNNSVYHRGERVGSIAFDTPSLDRQATALEDLRYIVEAYYEDDRICSRCAQYSLP